jgi:hypothetical protein
VLALFGQLVACETCRAPGAGPFPWPSLLLTSTALRVSLPPALDLAVRFCSASVRSESVSVAGGAYFLTACSLALQAPRLLVMLRLSIAPGVSFFVC